MTACRYNTDLGYRVLARSDDEPCPQRHCCVCSRGHCDDTTPQTCAECVGVVRENLAEILRLSDLLPLQAVHGGADGHLLAGAPIPGGDATVLLGPGSEGAQAEDHEHESWADPVPPLLLLATWEDDFRGTLGHPAGPRATMWRCVDYLGQHLTLMAQRHPAFEEFAADLARCRSRLEDTLGAGERDEHGAPCQDCGTLLVRRCHPRHGLVDEWTCRHCRVTYTAAEYWKAVERDYRDNAKALHAEAIEIRTGIPVGTVRVWATRGKVHRRGRDEHGRVLYDVEEVEDLQRRAEGEDLAAS